MLEKGLLDAAELDRILSTDNLLHPEYRGKRYVAGETRLAELGLQPDADGPESPQDGPADVSAAPGHSESGGETGSADQENVDLQGDDLR